MELGSPDKGLPLGHHLERVSETISRSTFQQVNVSTDYGPRRKRQGEAQ